MPSQNSELRLTCTKVVGSWELAKGITCPSWGSMVSSTRGCVTRLDSFPPVKY